MRLIDCGAFCCGARRTPGALWVNCFNARIPGRGKRRPWAATARPSVAGNDESVLAIGLEHRRAAPFVHQQHVVRRLASAIFRAIHAWRAQRHAGRRQPGGFGFLPQQPAHVAGRHMAFDGVAADTAVWREPWSAMPALRRMGPVSVTSCVVTAKPLSRMCLTQSSQQPQVGVFQTSTGVGAWAAARPGRPARRQARAGEREGRWSSMLL